MDSSYERLWHQLECNDPALTELILILHTNIDPAGWQAIFATLQTPTCRLQKLILDGNDISDDAFLSLSNSLANNNTVRELDCNSMVNITERGWQGFTVVFASPHSALVKLGMSHNAINDATKIPCGMKYPVTSLYKTLLFRMKEYNKGSDTPPQW